MEALNSDVYIGNSYGSLISYGHNIHGTSNLHCEATDLSNKKANLLKIPNIDQCHAICVICVPHSCLNA